MNNKVDLICIGAINFDHVFSCKKSEIIHKSKIDDGEETFVSSDEFQSIYDNIKSHSHEPTIDMGGSALLALKAVKNMASNINTAYVGVYGKIPKTVKKNTHFSKPSEIKNEISKFADNTDWLFESSLNTGCAIVNQHNKKRQFIRISTGANVRLLKKINSKIKTDSAGNNNLNSFVSFLQSAKWIHITSLPNINDFLDIMQYIGLAKENNRHLIVSMDPGYKYTKSEWEKLENILCFVDFLFLSKIEFSNVCKNIGFKESEKIAHVANQLKQNNSMAQILIIKEQSKTLLISLVNDTPFVRTYHHERLPSFKIMNDTGAGDVFAGGFIVGMLTPEMLSYQPAPIKLASTAAKYRLKSERWPENLRSVTYDFFEKNMKNEQRNIKQKLKIGIQLLKNPVIEIVIGFLLGLFTDWFGESFLW